MHPNLSILNPSKSIQYFVDYFETIRSIATSQNSGRPRWLRLLRYAFIFRMTQLAMFDAYRGMSRPMRIILVDYMYMIGVDSKFNVISLELYLLVYILFDQIYMRTLSCAYGEITYEALIKSDHHRLADERAFNAKMRKRAVLLINLLQPSTIIAHLIMLSTQFLLFYMSSENFDEYFYTPANTLLCAAKLVVTQANAILFYVCVFILSDTFHLSMSISIIGSMINFERLRRAEQRLRFDESPKNGSGNRNICGRNAAIFAFDRDHTKCRRTIFSFNRIFGRQLMYYVVLCTPPNAFTVLSLLLGHLPFGPSYIAGFGIVATQAAYIFGTHLFAVQYPRRIHRAAKRLMRIDVTSFVNAKPQNRFCSFRKSIDRHDDDCVGDRAAKSQNRKKTKNRKNMIKNRKNLPATNRYDRLNDIRAHLRLAHNVAMLHTANCYGITYASYGSASLTTFVKFLIFYVRFLVLSYKLQQTIFR